MPIRAALRPMSLLRACAVAACTSSAGSLVRTIWATCSARSGVGEITLTFMQVFGRIRHAQAGLVTPPTAGNTLCMLSRGKVVAKAGISTDSGRNGM